MEQEGTRKQINILNPKETNKLLGTKLRCDGKNTAIKAYIKEN